MLVHFPAKWGHSALAQDLHQVEGYIVFFLSRQSVLLCWPSGSMALPHLAGYRARTAYFLQFPFLAFLAGKPQTSLHLRRGEDPGSSCFSIDSLEGNQAQPGGVEFWLSLLPLPKTQNEDLVNKTCLFLSSYCLPILPLFCSFGYSRLFLGAPFLGNLLAIEFPTSQLPRRVHREWGKAMHCLPFSF